VPHRLFESEEELEELERYEVTTPTLLGLEYLTQGYDARMSDMDIERLADEEMERLQREGDDEQGILF
jgi:hypothetical protein